MKRNQISNSLIVGALCLCTWMTPARVSAQAYPFWDASSPGTPRNNIDPIAADSESLYGYDGQHRHIWRWTLCSGWYEIAEINYAAGNSGPSIESMLCQGKY